jgi:epoxyqueuosine reductase QueG
MPQGVGPLQTFVQHVIAAEDAETRTQRLHDDDFPRLFRALVQGVGTIAGCFHCLAACPVGDKAEDETDSAA